MLRRLYGDLQYTAAPFDTLLSNIKKDDLQALSWLTDDDTPTMDEGCFRKEERLFAQGLFSRLGMTDLDGQLKHLEHYAMLADQEETAAHERCERLSRVYVTMGLCAGLCLGIVLL